MHQVTYIDTASPTGHPYVEIIMESESDIASLPEWVAVGSIAVIADKNSKVYMFSPSGSWKEL